MLLPWNGRCLKVLSNEMDLAEIRLIRRRRFLGKSACPPILRKPFEMLERLLVFYLPIVQQFRKLQRICIHCALGLNLFLSFRNLQSQMHLSKLQKLDPSATDKCAMVFVPSLASEKRRNWGVFLRPLRNLQTHTAFIAAFTSEEW